MAGLFAFRCNDCGAIHEGSPSFGFDAPWHYTTLDEADKRTATLGKDTCVITHEEGVDRFVRGVLEVPIHGVEEPFLWGVWASLSEESYRRCLDTWGDPDEAESWFGWFCNRLPFYPDTINLKCRVHPRKGGIRPWIELAPGDHPLAVDFNQGISLARAQQIAEAVHHPPTPDGQG